jgi:hypothetical protein
MLDDLQRQLSESERRKQVLEDERNAWSAYLEAESSSQAGLEFESPEDLARAFVRERMERTELLNEIGAMKPELSTQRESIQSLENERAKFQAVSRLVLTRAKYAPA